MNAYRINQGLFILATFMALTFTQRAWAYDSVISLINGGIGQYTFKYQDQTQVVNGNPTGWHLGYIGRFSENLGIDLRLGGAGNTSGSGLKLQPGLFLSVLFRPSIPLSETVDLYGLLGFTSLAVGRTATNGSEEIIARVGASIGLGADYHLNKQMATGLEWVSYQRNVNFGPRTNSSGNWTGVTQASVSLSSIMATFKYQS
jgi:hypothetical protein